LTVIPMSQSTVISLKDILSNHIRSLIGRKTKNMNTNIDDTTEACLRMDIRDESREWVKISINGQDVQARQGEKLAAAMLASGFRVLRQKEYGGAPRGIFCGMGVCHECLVTVNGQPFVRACMTRVEPGMRVEVGSV